MDHADETRRRARLGKRVQKTGHWVPPEEIVAGDETSCDGAPNLSAGISL